MWWQRTLVVPGRTDESVRNVSSVFPSEESTVRSELQWPLFLREGRCTGPASTATLSKLPFADSASQQKAANEGGFATNPLIKRTRLVPLSSRYRQSAPEQHLDLCVCVCVGGRDNYICGLSKKMLDSRSNRVLWKCYGQAKIAINCLPFFFVDREIPIMDTYSLKLPGRRTSPRHATSRPRTFLTCDSAIATHPA